MRFTEWAPDAPNFVDIGPSIGIGSSYLMYPTTSGFRPINSSVARGTALPAQCLGAATIQKLNGTRRVFAGTTTAIYEFDGSAWSDVATPVYTATTSQRYIFAQFGDATLATNDADQLQVATTGNFAAVANSPKAKVMFTVPNFVILLNTNDGSGSPAYGDQGDRWWCSGFQDYTVWTPSLSTQCNTGRLIGQGGELTAGAKWGNGFIAYKEREMWIATKVDGPEVFRFDQVPGDQGCVGPEAVVDIGGAHIFVGSDNVWLFDGSTVRSIADGKVRDYLFGQGSVVSIGSLSKTRCLLDRQRMLVWFSVSTGSAAAGLNDIAFVYHITTGRWTTMPFYTEAAFNYFEPGITWGNIASTYATWNALSSANTQWGSSVWFPSGRSVALFGADHQMYTLTGSSFSASLDTKAFGLPVGDSTLRSIQLRGSYMPGSVSIQLSTYNTSHTGVALSSVLDISDQSFGRVNVTGRFHSVNVTVSSDCDIWGMDVDIVPAGGR